MKKTWMVYVAGDERMYLSHFISRENLSSGFASRYDSNQPAQLQRLARGLKFWI